MLFKVFNVKIAIIITISIKFFMVNCPPTILKNDSFDKYQFHLSDAIRYENFQLAHNWHNLEIDYLKYKNTSNILNQLKPLITRRCGLLYFERVYPIVLDVFARLSIRHAMLQAHSAIPFRNGCPGNESNTGSLVQACCMLRTKLYK